MRPPRPNRGRPAHSALQRFAVSIGVNRLQPRPRPPPPPEGLLSVVAAPGRKQSAHTTKTVSSVARGSKGIFLLAERDVRETGSQAAGVM